MPASAKLSSKVHLPIAPTTALHDRHLRIWAHSASGAGRMSYVLARGTFRLREVKGRPVVLETRHKALRRLISRERQVG